MPYGIDYARHRHLTLGCMGGTVARCSGGGFDSTCNDAVGSMASRFFETDDDRSAQAEHGDTEAVASGQAADAAQAGIERRFALLIGNAHYRSAKLVNPVADVRLLGNVLASLGFDVTILEDADRIRMQEGMAAFAARLDEAGNEAVALVHFAGHGVQDAGVNYLLPIDVDLPSRAYLRERTMPFDDVVAVLARTPRKATVIVLDACRRPPSDVAGEARDVTQGLAALQLPPDGMLVVYSTAAGAVADDGAASTNSPYAAALAQALPGVLTPDRRLHDVFVEAAERVKDATAGKQNPALYLQGALPPLTVTDADRERFATWVFYEPRWPRRRIANAVSAAVALVLICIASVGWFRSYPETRARLLDRVGLISNSAFRFQCATDLDATDRFGLTQRQWCNGAPNDILQAAKSRNAWSEALTSGLRDGDPRALLLAAVETLAVSNVGDEQRRAALVLAVRAGRAGFLPAWLVVADSYRPSDAITLAIGWEDVMANVGSAGAAGVFHAALRDGEMHWFRKMYDEAERRLTRLDATDATGVAAFTLAELFHQRGREQLSTDDVQAATKLWRRSATKGHGPALLAFVNFLRLADTDINADDMAAMLRNAIARDSPEAYFARAIYLLRKDPETNSKPIMADLEVAADRGLLDAISTLASIHERRPAPAEAMRWHARGAASGHPRMLYGYGAALALGLPVEDGRPRVAPDPAAGRPYLERAAAAGHARAKLLLADLHLTGAFGVRDVAAARSITADISTASTDKRAVEAARDKIDAAAQHDRLLERRPIPDLARGADDAPVSVVVYMPFGCAACRQFQADVIAGLAGRYVARNLVRVILRERFRTGTNSSTAQASRVVRCAPPKQQWDLAERIIANFDTWSAAATLDEQIDRLAAFERQTPGWSNDNTACVRDRRDYASIMLRADSLAADLGPSEIVVFVNGARLETPSADALERQLLSALSPQQRYALQSP